MLLVDFDPFEDREGDRVQALLVLLGEHPVKA